MTGLDVCKEYMKKYDITCENEYDVEQFYNRFSPLIDTAVLEIKYSIHNAMQRIHNNIINDQGLFSITDILMIIVSNEYNITLSEIKSKSRKQHVVDARQMYCYLAKKYMLSNRVIGRSINRDPSTVQYSKDIIESYISVRDRPTLYYSKKLQKRLDLILKKQSTLKTGEFGKQAPLKIYQQSKAQ